MERTVKGRTKDWIQDRMKSLEGSIGSSGSIVHGVINANNWGRCGSKVLRGLLDISDQVWNNVLGYKVGKGYK